MLEDLSRFSSILLFYRTSFNGLHDRKNFEAAALCYFFQDPVRGYALKKKYMNFFLRYSLVWLRCWSWHSDLQNIGKVSPGLSQFSPSCIYQRDFLTGCGRFLRNEGPIKMQCEKLYFSLVKLNPIIFLLNNMEHVWLIFIAIALKPAKKIP